MKRKTSDKSKKRAAKQAPTTDALAKALLGSLQDATAASDIAPDPATSLSGIASPPDEAVDRYAAIPLLFESLPDQEPMIGRVAYDSQAHGHTVGLRDVTDGYVRRLRLTAGRIVMDLVAERRENQWEFVARVYSGSEVTHDFVLKIGGRKLLAGSGGFFHWSSRSVPRKLRLLSYDTTVLFEGMSWR